MNFLAHIFLSGDNPQVMVGNFIGDFVKGKNHLQQFDDEVVFGIELHRSIDHYTDHHPIVKQSKTRLWQGYRHYAAVLIDVFYDHFLSRYWEKFCRTPLTQYSTNTYAVLKSFDSILPHEVRQLLPYMTRQNWLLNYGNFDGLQQTLNGMSRRASHESRMDQSLADLEENYDAFRAEFDQFLPDLIQHCNAILIQAQKKPIIYPI
ncbi:ACP phosphodiesterase [Chryseolinea sp. T2]|uniref:acyl carrier protein phosphodiesterase n=1 Tax=Chryseolinea sp. T2 TaxID=3129255 RepID=UPI0030781C6C